MRRRNLPTIDAGYWAAIVAASICGTNTGDLAAGPLGMGHVRGIIPLAVMFLAVVWAEKLLDLTTVAFYWMAIIVLRTMATNIADFATHDLKLSYPVFVLLLILLMGVMIWADRFRTSDTPPQRSAASFSALPNADWSYWIVMLTAGVLGTALGDWLADAGPGVYWASLISMVLFVGAVWAAYQYGLSKAWYWIAIAACRTWGTDLGDMLVALFRSATSRPVALWVSTAISAALLTGVIYFWTRRETAPALAASSEPKQA
jgi:uncharacterized membrane-anchored protein